MSRATRMTRAERRASIVEATMPLLEEFGHLLTTKQIADAAGIAEGTIFRAFESLQDVVDATVAHALSAKRLSKLLGQHDFPGDLDGDVAAALDAVGNYYDVVKTILHFGHGAPASVQSAVCARDHLAERYAELLEHLERRFAPHADQLQVSPRQFAQIVLMLASGQRGHSWLDVPPLTRDQLTGMVLDGVRNPR